MRTITHIMWPIGVLCGQIRVNQENEIMTVNISASANDWVVSIVTFMSLCSLVINLITYERTKNDS